MPKRVTQDSEQIYVRQLPGGGFVAINATPIRNLFGQRKFLGEVVVERRSDRERRTGHAAPVVAQVEANGITSVFHELFPIAHSNSAIATRCLERAPGMLPRPSDRFAAVSSA